jgi:hypothetical protein
MWVLSRIISLTHVLNINILQETDDNKLAVYNVPEEKAYATSDLFEPHPTKPGLWKM